MLLLIGLTSCNFVPEKDRVCKFRIKTLNEIETTTSYNIESLFKSVENKIITHKEVYVQDLSCLYRVNDTIEGGKVIIEKFE